MFTNIFSKRVALLQSYVNIYADLSANLPKCPVEMLKGFHFIPFILKVIN
jgi:hypothetical protein